jgi:SAM-dependent methyltransferase
MAMTAIGVDPYEIMVGFFDEWARNERDADLYVRRAVEVPGPVVELGVGTGRVAIPIAEAGQRVIGVDLSAAMLDEARRRAAMAGVSDRIAFAQADMAGFVAEAPVHLVIIPFRTFLHMETTEDQLRCLANVHRSLVSGGRLILNVFVPDPEYIVSQDRRRNLHGEFTDTLGRRCEIWVTPIYEVTTQRLAVRVQVEAYEGDRYVEGTETELRLRMVHRYEMQHLLERAGFEVEALYGDFDERPLTEECREMIWVARKP